jgi:hypothetical protein
MLPDMHAYARLPVTHASIDPEASKMSHMYDLEKQSLA